VHSWRNRQRGRSVRYADRIIPSESTVTPFGVSEEGTKNGSASASGIWAHPVLGRERGVTLEVIAKKLKELECQPKK
jgi:hypothetical protein